MDYIAEPLGAFKVQQYARKAALAVAQIQAALAESFFFWGEGAEGRKGRKMT